MVVSNADNESLKSFRESTNLNGRSEKDLIIHILKECLKFKKVYLRIDKTKSSFNPINKAQEELLGIKPYVVSYSPFDVVNWSEQAGKIQWIKVRQVVVDSSNPILPPLTKVIWTFIDSTYVATYEVSNVELDGKGKLSKISNEMVNEDTPITLSGVVEHGMREIPIVKVELPDEFWLTDQAAAKALEHLRMIIWSLR